MLAWRVAAAAPPVARQKKPRPSRTPLLRLRPLWKPPVAVLVPPPPLLPRLVVQARVRVLEMVQVQVQVQARAMNLLLRLDLGLPGPEPGCRHRLLGTSP